MGGFKCLFILTIIQLHLWSLNARPQNQAEILSNISAELAQVMKRIYKDGVRDCAMANQLDLKTLRTGKYHFNARRYFGYFEARDFCERYGMQLATINSKEEAQALAEARLSSRDLWTSGNDIGRETGKFHWADGRPIEKELWAPGQPGRGQRGSDSCAVLRGDALLETNLCGNSGHFVCELHPFCKE